MSTVEHSCGGNQEASLVQKGQRYKEHNREEYKEKSRESKLPAGQKCSGVGVCEGGDPELYLMQFCGYDISYPGVFFGQIPFLSDQVHVCHQSTMVS